MRDAVWQRAVLSAVGDGQADATWRAAGGSSLNATWKLCCGAGRYFVKTNAASRLAMFEAEAEGLAELGHAAALRVPRPIATGAADGTAYLVLEHLAIGRDGCGAALGTALARLHRHTAKEFGWHRDNTIGTTPQRNAPSRDWITFFRERRLGAQLEFAAANGYRGRLQNLGARLSERLPEFFASYAPVPSLLHGDLWGGNWGCVGGTEPVVFDPAVYYGDREADLAMTELFGGFPPAFHTAYREAWPLDPGYAVRKALYNLYHVLNHLNLFGGGYLGQAEAVLDRLLAEFA